MLIVQKHLQAVTKALMGKESAPIGELLDKINQLQAEIKLLAMLASDKPEFFNPAKAMEAKAIRDRVLKGK